MLIVRLAGDHLYGEIAVRLAVAVLSFFPRDVLDEIWDLIESVSEGFPIYFWCRVGRPQTSSCPPII